MFSRLSRPAPIITFTCSPEDLGVIAEPLQAKKALPDWFRRLPAIDKTVQSATNSGITIKRCMPFLDALATGWILPLAATVRLDIKDGGKTVDAGWEFDRTMVSNHGAHQVAGHPRGHLPPCKFHNYWTIRTPPGWSCLFLPPLNRPDVPFECLAGIVDTDTYTAPVHFPFFATGKDGLHVVAKGTPLVQVIPFRRDAVISDAEIRAERVEEGERRVAMHRSTTTADGWYRQHARAER